MRKVCVIASASGSGKSTLARALAARLAVPYLEVDALAHGPGWSETPAAELKALVAPTVAQAGWVIDGVYEDKLGDLVLAAADLIVWLDLPLQVWLPRLLRRTGRRLLRHEELWNGNYESLRASFFSRDSLLIWSLRSHFRRRRVWPQELAAYPLVRLRSTVAVEAFLAGVLVGANGVAAPDAR